MNRLIKLFLVVLSVFSFSQTKTNGSIQKCSEQELFVVKEKLKLIDRYHKIDNYGRSSVFNLKANLRFSKQLNPSKYENTFHLYMRPAPILAKYLDNDPMSDSNKENLPKFIMKCDYSNNDQQIICKSENYTHKKFQYVVEDFHLVMNVEEDDSCSSGARIDIKYSIKINDSEYEEVKTIITNSVTSGAGKILVKKVIDYLADVETFFSEYWDAFFSAWEKNTWMED